MNFHGGDIYSINGGILDFSSNINPLGVPDSFRSLLTERLGDFTRYPDIEYREVKKHIAKYIDMQNMDWIIPGNGAVELIYKLVASSEAKSVIGLSPTFSEYERAARACGKEFIGVPAFGKDFSIVDMELLLSNVKPNSLFIICNPNNPTGTLIEKAEMQRLAAMLNTQGSKLIIDEAFIEFTDSYPKNSMSDMIGKYDNISVIRAATKFFGMPGIRLGYALTADGRTAKGLRDVMEPWNLNTAAVIAAACIFDDKNYIENTRSWISTERQCLFEGLSNICGLKVYPSKANYHLLEIASCKMTAAKLKQAMIKEGILIRTADGFRNLSEYHFRLAVKDGKSNEVLLKTLEKCLVCLQ